MQDLTPQQAQISTAHHAVTSEVRNADAERVATAVDVLAIDLVGVVVADRGVHEIHGWVADPTLDTTTDLRCTIAGDRASGHSQRERAFIGKPEEAATLIRTVPGDLSVDNLELAEDDLDPAAMVHRIVRQHRAVCNHAISI